MNANTRGLRVIFRAIPFLLAAAAPPGGALADAGEDGVWAGVFAGAARADNRLVDIDGFANWGNPGWSSDYDSTGWVGGAVAGTGFDLGGLPLRVEIEGMFGGASARTNMLDPEGGDEMAEADLRWAAAARIGAAWTPGPLTFFAGAGPAAARIENSATDMDRTVDPATGRPTPWRPDPDDSFRDDAVKFGWTASAGVETEVADGWTLRLEGAWMDFGSERHAVNRDGGNRCCGAGTDRRPVAYEVENAFAIVRLAIVRRFGR